MVVLKGLKTGKAIVRLMINEKGYRSVEATSLQLHVIEHFTIFPDRKVFLLPKSTLRYQLSTVLTQDKIFQLK